MDPSERLRLPDLAVDRARLRHHHVAAVVHHLIDRWMFTCRLTGLLTCLDGSGPAGCGEAT
jgi:hypothetical protein